MTEPSATSQQPVTSLSRDHAGLAHLKVALVCDWLTGIGGAERVVLELHRMFPNAPIYTSQYDPSKINWFNDADIRPSWLQKLPKGLKKFLPVLRARSFSRLKLDGYDLVISSSGAEAKFVKVGPSTKHVAYIHSPTHYYWMRYDEYLARPGFGSFDPLARLGLKLLVGPMRKRDFRAAQRPNYLIANSTFTQENIQKYYSRDSVVIHPPVDMERFVAKPVDEIRRSGYIIAGRQTPYKKIDLAIAACTELNLPLTVVGDGPDHAKLVKMAGPSIKFVTSATDEEVAKHFQSAMAFIFPGVDDFGIVAVEAMASGMPVIAFKGGGALDYVIEGQTGMFFAEQTIGSLVGALKIFHADDYSTDVIQSQTQTFSPEQFKYHILDYLAKVML